MYVILLQNSHQFLIRTPQALLPCLVVVEGGAFSEIVYRFHLWFVLLRELLEAWKASSDFYVAFGFAFTILHLWIIDTDLYSIHY